MCFFLKSSLRSALFFFSFIKFKQNCSLSYKLIKISTKYSLFDNFRNTSFKITSIIRFQNSVLAYILEWVPQKIYF